MKPKLLCLLSLCLLGPPVQARELSPELARKTFLSVWEKIDASFYDRTFNGLDWQAIREKYQSQVDEAESNKELRVVLNAMLGELGRSHFGVIGTSAATKVPGTKGTYLGLELRHSDGRLIVYEVAPRSPAAKAGLTPGMEILEVEEEPLATLLKRHTIEPQSGALIVYRALEEIREEMGTPEDRKTTLKVKGREKAFDFAPGRYRGEYGKMGPEGSYPMSFETKLLPGDQKVRLIDFNLFLPALMPRLNKAMARAKAENADGLVIDLRGNPGGLGIMATGLIGRLIDQELDLGDMNNPSGNLPFHAFPQENAYLGPVAVLIDNFSASTSEIFAAALQEHKRARIIGRPTMGAVLPSMIDKLPNGDRLQYAIGDFVTAVNKVHLEGKGVTPDELIPLNPAVMREGQDPDLEAALRWIKTQKTTTKE
ncbi:S41 family peptidase [Verrucomicrobiaceae bacterium 227]